MSDKAPLKTFMDLAMTKVPGLTNQNLFPAPNQPYPNSGILSKNQEHEVRNHILLFGGAFNPPHLGHLAAIQSVRVEALTNLNIVATILAVLPDEHLEGKNFDAGETFVIKQQDRARLWASHPDIPGETWIYAAKGMVGKTLLPSLLNEAAAQGFLISVVQMCGTDSLHPDRPFSAWDPKAAAIVTDAGRKSLLFNKEHIDQLAGYSEWNQMRGASEARAETWYCHNLEHSSFRVYLVLVNEGAEFSSTRFRKALREKEGEDLVEDLKTMALNPRLLLNTIQSGSVEMEEGQLAKLKGDKILQDFISPR